MQTPSRGKFILRRAVVACLVGWLLLPAPAGARTQKHRKPSVVTVALQPFRLARAIVHTVADPIVEPIVDHAPRAIATLATAPVRIAYRSVRDHRDEALRGEQGEEPVIRRAARTDQSIPVAYMVPRPRQPVEPDPDQSADVDQEIEQVPAVEPEPERFTRGPTVAGSHAVLRGGIAYAPARAPQSVKNAIWAANTLRRKPYVWGGGHGSFYDRGYDCSGTVSFALHGAGAIAAPMPSSDLMRYGERGRGRWVTIYARSGHTFAVIAGLRLDTTDFQNGGNTGPRWHTDQRDTRGYAARHPAGL